MKANVGGFDKWARIVVGVLLIVWAGTGGPVWAWIGVVPLATGLFKKIGLGQGEVINRHYLQTAAEQTAEQAAEQGAEQGAPQTQHDGAKQTAELLARTVAHRRGGRRRARPRHAAVLRRRADAADGSGRSGRHRRVVVASHPR